jgi:two-component system sensor histidine kinase/response regulator
MKSSPATPPDILLVDDTPENLHLLCTMLKAHGYKVRPVSSGEFALRAVQSSPPDLVLLDITMPGMSGLEVCERLKADEAWRDIPVLFLSALNETADKVRGFQAGGVDYVTKPFQLEEVEARVRTHLELRRKTIELERSYKKLRELERLRDSLTHMVVHDMRSPLLALGLSLDMMAESGGSAYSGLDLLRLARQSVTNLIEMATTMLDVSRLESYQMMLNRVPTDLVALAQESIEAHRVMAKSRPLTLESAGPVQAEVDLDVIRRVIGNLIGNALKFTSAQGAVAIRVASDGERARVAVEDNGPGIAPEKQRHIFEKFSQLDNAKGLTGTGLGLAFSKLAVEAHGGTIGIESKPGSGSIFWFALPLRSVSATRAAGISAPARA